ncbi:sialate O-acetylesterase [Bifidobacterium amazonense]|uniref:Sialate O-acetylesterase n=1 Tax=Bifidobacterium amazonense TaxID=2809027 RepID=A0ABS9VX10_9BIFI|nr:sialate O-acetylesterase [Bifidobacterium amazonense]MCH9276638.1 sialate O-acetylesterase [Bifidobacterium amazonense]
MSQQQQRWMNRTMLSVSLMIVIVLMVTASQLFVRQNVASAQQQTFVQATSVTLPNYYMENMVFQRNETMSFRGKTEHNATITVTVARGNTITSRTSNADDSGNFSISLPSPKAQLEPYTLTVSSGKTVLKRIRHVYVGDVFLAAGQSNMEVNYDDYYGTEALRKANLGAKFTTDDLPQTIDDSHVYFLVTDKTASSTPESELPVREYNDRSWLPATSDNTDRFGYLPQFFAQQVRETTPNVPIGIIQIAWGGTTITRQMAGGDIYNTHITPLKGFKVAGVLWYQGEQDADSYDTALAYQYNFTTLISQYRSFFKNKNLPFLYVQLARYGGGSNWSTIRQAQFAVAANSGRDDAVAMTVSIDTDRGTDTLIHPFGKELVAIRMADQWKAIRDGDDVPDGPLATAAVSEDDGSTAVVSFKDGTGSGLAALAPNYTLEADKYTFNGPTSQALTNFEAAGDDGVFYPANATISGDTVVITSDKVRRIRQVRYLWEADPSPKTLLYNSYDLPASPFTITVASDEDE